MTSLWPDHMGWLGRRALADAQPMENAEASPFAAFMRGGAQALSFGVNDEIGAAIRTMLDYARERDAIDTLIGPHLPPDRRAEIVHQMTVDTLQRTKAYERNLENMRRPYEKAAEEHFPIFLAGEIMGAMPWAYRAINPSNFATAALGKLGAWKPAQTAAGKALQAGVTGGFDSAVYATATSKGSVPTRMRKAISPALHAAGLGTLGPAVGRMLKAGVLKTATKGRKLLEDAITGPHTGIGLYEATGGDHHAAYAAHKAEVAIKDAIRRELAPDAWSSAVPYAEDMKDLGLAEYMKRRARKHGKRKKRSRRRHGK